MPYNSSQPQDPDIVSTPLIGMVVDKRHSKHGSHSHKKAQLLYCSHGVLHFYCHSKYFLLPPGMAIWIPAGWVHDMKPSSAVSYHSLYIDVDIFHQLPDTMQIMMAKPLLRALIVKVCGFTPGYTLDSPEFHVAQVVVDEINIAKNADFFVPRPQDKRLNKLFDYLQDNPGATQSVKEFADQVHITTRTLTRLCQKELGMSFEKWSSQINLLHAFALLGKGDSVTQVSQTLGYSHDSAFITRFKQWTGETPAQYRKRTLNCKKSLL